MRVRFDRSGQVADAEPYWEVAALVAALDPTIAGRLLAAHPPDGWCRPCRTGAPCPTRGLAEAIEHLPERAGESGTSTPSPTRASPHSPQAVP